MCILPFSCSLDEESRTEIDKNRFMKNALEAETVLLGVYQSLVSDAMYGYHLSILFNLATDCEQVEGSTTENYRIIPSNAFNASQAEIQQTWAALYKAIYNANDFMEILQQRMNDFNETDKQLAYIYIAEARAIRGMCYFELVRRFGNVPLMTNTAMSEQAPSTFVQEKPETIYKFIEEDLLYAIQTLPYAIDDTNRQSSNSGGGCITRSLFCHRSVIVPIRNSVVSLHTIHYHVGYFHCKVQESSVVCFTVASCVTIYSPCLAACP